MVRTKLVSSLATLGLLFTVACGDDDEPGETQGGTETETEGDGDGTTGDDTADTTADGTATGMDGTADGSDTGTADGTATGGEGNAQVRVIHASAGAPAVDVWVQGADSPAFTDVEYGENEEYIEVPEGDYVFEIRAAGAGADEDPVYTTDSISLAADGAYTAIATGNLGSEDEADSFRVLALEDGFGDPGDAALVRIVHASANAPTVAIDVGDDEDVEIESLERFADTGAEGVELPAGEPIQIAIRANGDRITAFTAQLEAGSTSYVLATGIPGLYAPGSTLGFKLLATDADGGETFIDQNPWIFAVHGSHDTPPVDACVAGVDTPVFEDLAFGQAAVRQVPPSTYTFNFYEGDEANPQTCDGTAAIDPVELELMAGTETLAIATGSFVDGELQIVTPDTGFGAPPQSGASVRFFHAAADVEAVDFGTVTDGTFTTASTNVAPLASRVQESFPAGDITFAVAENGETTPVVEGTTNLADPSRAFIIAIGSADPQGEEAPLALLRGSASELPWTFEVISGAAE